MLRFLILFVICFSYGKTQQNSDVIGCGGFIKSETDINYKVVRVNKYFSLFKKSIYLRLLFLGPINHQRWHSNLYNRSGSN